MAMPVIDVAAHPAGFSCNNRARHTATLGTPISPIAPETFGKHCWKHKFSNRWNRLGLYLVGCRAGNLSSKFSKPRTGGLGNLTHGLLRISPKPSARLRVPATVLLSAWQRYWSGAPGDGHDHSQRHATPARYRTRYAAPLGLARCRGPHRNEVRLRHRAMRRLHGPHQRAAHAVLLGADRERRRR